MDRLVSEVVRSVAVLCLVAAFAGGAMAAGQESGSGKPAGPPSIAGKAPGGKPAASDNSKASSSKGSPSKASSKGSSPEGASEHEKGHDHEKEEGRYDRDTAAMDLEEEKLAKRGFEPLGLASGTDGSETAGLIIKNIIPDLAKDLPWPAPGFGYLLKDIDGDGGPELFVALQHWTVCENGCQMLIYRFENGEWKQLFRKETIEIAVHVAKDKNDKAEIALIDLGPEAKGPTRVRLFRLEGDRFVPRGEHTNRKPEK
jgi:hypothetical protein